ncbi:MAG: Stp1/IreP family PP2C-type Ser/Thr phosphatase [Simkaniaceae bacterium]|nr:Stp1/IreP family PP2C-type Ser/Thr phosphatase [Candidatus Sacchlamyda saccharinae]
MRTAMKIEAFGATDIGLSRINNEDAFALLPEQQCFLLADGMGGHKAGEVAASETIVQLADTVKKEHPRNPSSEEWERILIRAFSNANNYVYSLSQEREDLQGMGTTICMALFTDSTLVCVHVGDSRIYRIRKGRISQITRDHSLKADLIASGELDETLANSFPHKNVITRAIGTQKRVEPDISKEKIEKDDIYFLCSDGLTDPLSDAQIQHIIDGAPNPREATENLILEAKKAGGGDNITVISVFIH